MVISWNALSAARAQLPCRFSGPLEICCNLSFFFGSFSSLLPDLFSFIFWTSFKSKLRGMPGTLARGRVRRGKMCLWVSFLIWLDDFDHSASALLPPSLSVSYISVFRQAIISTSMNYSHYHLQAHNYNIAIAITTSILIITIAIIIAFNLINFTIITNSLPPPVPPCTCAAARQLHHLQPPPSSTKRD